MEQVLLSVVVPAYNVKAWLSRCLDSILAQEGVSLEVIVVNDGSTDGTGAVLDAYTESHPQVRAVHQKNGGVTAARLRGVAEAKGEWVTFADGDDEIEPWMYNRMLENAQKCGAQIACCGHQICYPDGRIEEVHGTEVSEQLDRLQGLMELLDGGRLEPSLCTKLFRRELFRGLENWMDPTIKNNEDLLMNYHLFCQAETVAFEDVCPYHYLLREGSASYHRRNEACFFDPIRVRQKILETCSEQLRPAARQALLRNCLFAYGRLIFESGEVFRGYRRRVRKLLQEQREYFHLLSGRNRLLAQMICTAPWSFHITYWLYVRLFQRQEQH